jgi:hypothetical protein
MQVIQLIKIFDKIGQKITGKITPVIFFAFLYKIDSNVAICFIK